MKELDLIQTFEPAFVEAANLAASLKRKATARDKFKSGFADIDIVTSADLEVQEFLLKKLADSELRNCEIVAEEDTPSKKLFAQKSDFVVTIDPIDGTKLFAEGKNTYTLIISIHDKKRPIYTFDYYPELKWGVKIVNDKCEFIGQAPKFNIKKLPKVITYSGSSRRDPAKTIPELHSEFCREGYEFKPKQKICNYLGATGQFILGYADGLYQEDGSAVDCLVALHFAIANGYEIHQNINLSKSETNWQGSEIYKGWYLVVRK